MLRLVPQDFIRPLTDHVINGGEDFRSPDPMHVTEIESKGSFDFSCYCLMDLFFKLWLRPSGKEIPKHFSASYMNIHPSYKEANIALI